MKPKHSLLAALCALSFAGAAQAATSRGRLRWSGALEQLTGYPQGESFVHLGSLYQTSVDVVRGEEPFRSGRRITLNCSGAALALSIPASILNPLDGSVLYQGVRPAIRLGVGHPVVGRADHARGCLLQRTDHLARVARRFDPYVYVPGFFRRTDRLGAARLEFRVEYADGSGLTEAAKLEVLPAAAIDRVAPAAPNVVLQSVGADRVGIRWECCPGCARRLGRRSLSRHLGSANLYSR